MTTQGEKQSTQILTEGKFKILTFRKEWPFNRMWPVDDVSKAWCKIAKRQTLKQSELAELYAVGFDIELETTEKE
jgi:hypothetical protein